MLQSELVREDREYEMEEQGNCFFCVDTLDEGLQIVSVRHIWHYLRLDIKYFARDGENSVISKDLEVALCGNCGPVAQHLNNLCSEMEMIQMQVDHSIQELSRMINVSSSPIAGEDESSLIREVTRDLANEALKRSHYPAPNVKLYRLKSSILRELLSGPDFPTSVEERTPAHPCPFCNVAEQSAQNLTNHTMIHHPEQLFGTAKLHETSDEDFRELCISHMKNESRLVLANGFYKCSQCPTAFKEKPQLMCHLVNKHQQKLEAILRDAQRSSDGHLASRDGEPDGDEQLYDSSAGSSSGCPCPECGLVLSDASTLQHHRETNCGERSVETCTFCEFTFDSKYQLRKHVSEEHKVVARNKLPTKCPYCTKVVSERRNLKRHIKGVHPQKFQELFTYHGQPIESVLQLESVETSDVTPSPEASSFKCKFCSQVFKNIFELSRHVKHRHLNSSVNGATQKNSSPHKMVKCPNCSSTMLARSLSRHLRDSCEALRNLGLIQDSPHSTSNDGPGYPCKLCGATFKSYAALGGHMAQRHTQRAGEVDMRPRIQCPYCPRDFLANSNLARHIRYDHPDINETSTSNHINFSDTDSSATVNVETLHDAETNSPQIISEQEMQPVVDYPVMDFIQKTEDEEQDQENAIAENVEFYDETVNDQEMFPESDPLDFQ